MSVIKNYYIEKWNNGENEKLDKRLEKIDANFDEWLKQIPSEQHQMIYRVLDNFSYYSHQYANIVLVSLHERLVERYSISEDDTIFTFIKSKQGKSNSSNDYWTEYRMLNQINKESSIVDIKKIQPQYWEQIKNIVFVDDCCGTGKSFIDYLSDNLDIYKDKTIYLVILHIMEDAKNKIKEFEGVEKLEIKIVDFNTTPKAFTSNILGDGFENDKHQIVELSKKFLIPEEHILGFRKSEALIGFYNNTPNNTIGILRFDTKNYNSIFPRENPPRPRWQKLKGGKTKRKKENYNAASRKGD